MTKQDLIKIALATAREEGFLDAKEWETQELLVWYRSCLEFDNKPVPEALKRFKVDIS